MDVLQVGQKVYQMIKHESLINDMSVIFFSGLFFRENRVTKIEIIITTFLVATIYDVTTRDLQQGSHVKDYYPSLTLFYRV